MFAIMVRSRALALPFLPQCHPSLAHMPRTLPPAALLPLKALRPPLPLLLLAAPLLLRFSTFMSSLLNTLTIRRTGSTPASMKPCSRFASPPIKKIIDWDIKYGDRNKKAFYHLKVVIVTMAKVLAPCIIAERKLNPRKQRNGHGGTSWKQSRDARKIVTDVFHSLSANSHFDRFTWIKNPQLEDEQDLSTMAQALLQRNMATDPPPPPRPPQTATTRPRIAHPTQGRSPPTPKERP